MFSRGIDTLNVLCKMREIWDGEDKEWIPSIMSFQDHQPENHQDSGRSVHYARSRIPTLGAHTTASNQISHTANGQSLTSSAVLSSNSSLEYASNTASSAGEYLHGHDVGLVDRRVFPSLKDCLPHDHAVQHFFCSSSQITRKRWGNA